MWQNPPERVDLVAFTEETLNERLYFLSNEYLRLSLDFLQIGFTFLGWNFRFSYHINTTILC